MRNINMSYYKVYYYCDIIDRLLYRFTGAIDWASTGAQFTEPFFQGEVDNFPKHSALHSFCEFAINKLMTEDAEKDIEEIQEKYDELSDLDKPKRLAEAFNYDGKHPGLSFEVDDLFRMFKVEHETFYQYLLRNDFEFIIDAYNDFIFLDGDLEDIVLQLSRELFYILFQNRDFLYRFNYYMSSGNSSIFLRCNIPLWVKRAVRFRDRGRCVCCGKDLSGAFDCEDENAVHYDHIVSLHEGGLNDVCNIQLLCRDCNLSKSSASYTNTTYKDWYDFE